MSTRRGFVSVPASFGEGVAPLDCIIANAGTHCWESAWARRVGLHWWITTKFQRLGMLVLGGSSKGWNQWVGASVSMDWTEGRKHVVNKATKCMPLLNRSAKGPAWNPYRFWDGAASHVAVGVDLLDKYEPVKFERDGVAFRSLDGGPDRVVGADVVVFATGYRQKFPFLFGAGAEEEGELLAVARREDDDVRPDDAVRPAVERSERDAVSLELDGLVLVEQVHADGDVGRGAVPEAVGVPRGPLGAPVQQRHALRRLVDDVLPPLRPVHGHARADPLVPALGRSAEDEHAQPLELRRDPPVEADAPRPRALPAVRARVGDDAVQGRDALAERRGHGHEAAPRRHGHGARAGGRGAVGDVEGRLARAWAAKG